MYISFNNHVDSQYQSAPYFGCPWKEISHQRKSYIYFILHILAFYNYNKRDLIVSSKPASFLACKTFLPS